MKKLFYRIFSLSNFLVYAERICTIGIIIPILHFVALPLGLFRYVFVELLSSDYVINEVTKEVTFTTTQIAFDGFFWLMSFWTIALLTIPAVALAYYIMNFFYKNNVFGRIFAKGILAIIVTSGNIERYIGTQIMSISVDNAPAFEGSLYKDLGALVRSSPFNFNDHSLMSFYTRVLTVGIILVFIAYFWLQSAKEVRKANSLIKKCDGQEK